MGLPLSAVDSASVRMKRKPRIYYSNIQKALKHSIDVESNTFNTRPPRIGDIATVIEIYTNPPGYELESPDDIKLEKITYMHAGAHAPATPAYRLQLNRTVSFSRATMRTASLSPHRYTMRSRFGSPRAGSPHS